MPVSNSQKVPVKIVGSSTFGIYPKISLEKTYNMFISDEWLVNYAGFRKRSQVGSAGKGRALYTSARGGFMIAVIGDGVYKISSGLGTSFIGSIDTSSGTVSIAENNVNQICIVDGLKAYIYNYSVSTFTTQTLVWNGNAVRPAYVDYHNTYFLIGSSELSTNTSYWYAAARATDDTIAIALQDQFQISTKPDTAKAVLRMPGRGNNVIVFGNTVAEIWTHVGGTENYRRVSSTNINTGTISSATIAASDDMIVWLASNEDEAPVIMVTNGSESRQISTDGISSLIESLSRPDESTGFIYKQNGHLFYHLTFYNSDDNLSLLYDFNTDKFYHISDESLNYHPARISAFFNKKVYFVSLDDNCLYEMSQDLVDYNYSITDDSAGDVIPRIRITNTIRKDDSSIFRTGSFTFWIEQGVTTYPKALEGQFTCDGLILAEDGSTEILTEDEITILAEDGGCSINDNRPRLDLSFSKNGNQSFSNVVSRYLNSQGVYRNQINWHKLGHANELTFQIRFYGLNRFVANNGIIEIY